MVKVVDKVGPPKRKRYNKNKKKAWRKKAEIQDIEDKLEEDRREERYGGPLEEREDQELLFLDVGGENDTKPVEPVTFEVDTRPGLAVGFKVTSRKRPVKPLRSHQLLKGLQGAKTTHKAKTKNDKVNSVMKQMQSKAEAQAKKRNLTEKFEKKVKQIEAAKKQKTAPKVSNRMNVNFIGDAWDPNSNELVKRCKENGVEEGYVNDIMDFYSTITKTRAFNVPGYRFKQTSALPAVTIPEAGQSYNPSYADHQTLLEKAVKQEVKRRQVEAQHKRALKKWFPTADEAPTEETWLTEMSEGLPKAEGNEEDSEEENAGPEIDATVSGKRTTERKTKKQRKREVKQKFRERKKLLAKERRVRESNVYRIKTYKKEIKEGEKLLKTRQASRKAYWEQKKSKPHRLGKAKYVPEDIAVSLGHELHGSLRKAKPAVNLIEERFKNFQRRNLIETRDPFKHKPSQRKKTVMKRDHKEALEEIEKMAEAM